MIYKETLYLIFQNVWNFSTWLGHAFLCSKPHDHLLFLLVDLKFNLDILYLRKILYLSCIFLFHTAICLHVLKKAYLTDADLTEQDSNLELKTFHIVLFLVSIFFRFVQLKIKTQFKIIMVTFHPGLSAYEFFDITDGERCC